MDPLAAAEQAHLSFDRLMSSRFPDIEVVETTEDFYGATGLPSPYMNRVLRTQWSETLSPERCASRVQAIIAWFTARHVPFLWQIAPSTRPAALPALLEAAGLRRTDEGPVMTCELATVRPVASPAGLQIHVIDDEADFLRWGAVASAAFEREAGGPLPSQIAGYRLPLRRFLAELEGEPVATASTLLDGTVALITDIGARAPARRQGIGSAITAAALQDAREHGVEIAALTASELGYPVYRRLGFVERYRAISYLWTPPAPGDDQT